jgi:hypothetical protein
MLSCNRDVLLLVFSHCSLHDVGALARVCTVIAGATDDFWGRWAGALLPAEWLSGRASMKEALREMRRPLGKEDFLFGCQDGETEGVVTVRLDCVWVSPLELLSAQARARRPTELRGPEHRLVGRAQLRVDKSGFVPVHEVALSCEWCDVTVKFRDGSEAQRFRRRVDANFDKWGTALPGQPGTRRLASGK